MIDPTLQALAAELSHSDIQLGEKLSETQNSRVFVANRAGNEQLAIKVLDPRSGADLRGLQNEIAALGRLSGSGYIVQIRGYGFSGVTPWLAMEWCDGGSLEQHLTPGQPLSIAESLRVGISVARALGAAADVGVMHLDIKPANILISGGTYKLADFGLARAFGEGASGWTPTHAAPEQASHARLDESADCYSVASTLFQCLSGWAPYGIGQVASDIKQQKPQRIPLPDLSWVPIENLRLYLQSALDPVPARRNPINAVALEEILCELWSSVTGRVEMPVLLGRQRSGAPQQIVPAAVPRAGVTPHSDQTVGLGERSGQRKIPPRSSGSGAGGAGFFGRRSQAPAEAAPSAPAPLSHVPNRPTDTTVHRGAANAPRPAGSKWPYWVAGIAVAVALALGVALFLATRPDPTDVVLLADQAAVEVAKTADPTAQPLAASVADTGEVTVSLKPPGDGPYLLQRLEFTLEPKPGSSASTSANDRQRVLQVAGPVKRTGEIDEASPARFGAGPTSIDVTIDPAGLTCFRLLDAEGDELRTVGAEACLPDALPAKPVIDDPGQNFAPGEQVELSWSTTDAAMVSGWWLVTFRDSSAELASVKRLDADVYEGSVTGDSSMCVVVVATNAMQPAESFEVGDELDLNMAGVSGDVCPWIDS